MGHILGLSVIKHLGAKCHSLLQTDGVPLVDKVSRSKICVCEEGRGGRVDWVHSILRTGVRGRMYSYCTLPKLGGVCMYRFAENGHAQSEGVHDRFCLTGIRSVLEGLQKSA